MTLSRYLLSVNALVAKVFVVADDPDRVSATDDDQSDYEDDFGDHIVSCSVSVIIS